MVNTKPIRKRNKTSEPGITILVIIFILLSLGVVMVYSASAFYADKKYGDQMFFLKRHLMWLSIGIILMFITSRLDYWVWHKLTPGLIVVTIFLLVLVLLFGKSVYGARRWFRFGSFSFQPSELAKIVMIIFSAYYLDKHRSRLDSFLEGILPFLAVLGTITGLIYAEKDIGTPLVVTVTCLIMLMVAGAKPNHITYIILGALTLLVISITTKAYRWERVISFFNNSWDPQGTGYQLNQSLFAIGSGGFWGKGIGNGLIKHFYLPEPHTDFVFPILAEELGFIGTFSVLALFTFLTIKGWQVSLQTKTFFGQLLGMGISIWLTFQALFNISVTCGLLPTKGLPLPFLSFGGSSLLTSLFGVGILLNLARRSR